MGTAWTIIKRALRDFMADDAMSLAGALAFYTALSMAPLLVIVLAIAGFLWQDGDVQGELVRQVQSLIGQSGADTVATIMREAGRERAHGLAAVVGVATLLFGATSVFAQLQYSLNRVWNVESKPGEDVADFLRKRLLSLGMILVIAFLLVVSLVVTAGLNYISGSARTTLPGGDATWQVINFFGSMVVYTGIFTLMHHTLPDVKMAWRDSLFGGVVTALLFALGKELLGWYLGRSSVSSAYGAAGSFFVVLLWVYYSSLILFVGAELTQAFAGQLGHPVTPDAHARVMYRDDKAVSRPA
jgi:membrane protein